MGTALVALALSAATVSPTYAANAGGKCSKAGVLSGTTLKPLICKRVGKKLVWRNLSATTVTVAPTTTVTVAPTTTVYVAPTTTVYVAPTTTVARSSCPTGQIRIVPDKLYDGYLFYFNVYNETSASVLIDFARVKFFGSSYGTSITSAIWSQDSVFELRTGWRDYRRAMSNVISPNGVLYDASYRWYRTQYDVYQGNRLCSPPQVVIDQTVLASSK
jgi:hypothetical protein